jgi:hypothetical protein
MRARISSRVNRRGRTRLTGPGCSSSLCSREGSTPDRRVGNVAHAKGFLSQSCSDQQPLPLPPPPPPPHTISKEKRLKFNILHGVNDAPERSLHCGGDAASGLNCLGAVRGLQDHLPSASPGAVACRIRTLDER